MTKHSVGVLSLALCSGALAMASAGCAGTVSSEAYGSKASAKEVVKERGYYVDSKTAARFGGVGNYIPRHRITAEAPPEEKPAEARVQAQAQPAVQPQPAAKPAPSTGPSLVKINEKLFFSTDSAELRPEVQTDLADLGKQMASNPARKVAIEGYADATGSTQHNLELSKRRAQAVKDVLIKAGAKPDQIFDRGMGEGNPVASNDTAQGRARNRRAVIQPRG